MEIVTKAGKVIVSDHNQNEIHTIKATPISFILYSSAKIFLIFSVFHKSVKGRFAGISAIGMKEVDMSSGIVKCHPVLSWFVRWIGIGNESHSCSFAIYFGSLANKPLKIGLTYL